MRIVLDIETTGFSPKTDRIVSIAAAVTPTEAAMAAPPVFSRLVRPGRQIPPRATAVHGITNAQVEREPNWSAVGAEFWSWVFAHCPGHQPVVLVGHNIVQFDMPFILAESARYRAQMPKHQCGISLVDTLLISREMFPKNMYPKEVLASKKQCDVHQHLFGEQPDAQHTAMGDVLALKRIFEHAQFQAYVDSREDGAVAGRFNYKIS